MPPPIPEGVDMATLELVGVCNRAAHQAEGQEDEEETSH